MVKCSHCKHEWPTISKSIMVTCSSCNKKTKNTDLISDIFEPTRRLMRGGLPL